MLRNTPTDVAPTPATPASTPPPIPNNAPDQEILDHSQVLLWIARPTLGGRPLDGRTTA